MNRLSPLIVRRVGAFAPQPRGGYPDRAGEARLDPLQDLKLFAKCWVGGLVFFGTLLD